MKPAWDELMAEYESSDSVLIADVDCTAGGQALCEKMGVRGYPTIKHGDPNNMEDYEGGRDAAALKEFATSLGPTCSPANLALCSDEKKVQIKDLMAKGKPALEELIKGLEAESEEAEAAFKSGVEELQGQYEALQKTKEEKVKAVKESGLGLMKAVKATLGAATGAEL